MQMIFSDVKAPLKKVKILVENSMEEIKLLVRMKYECEKRNDPLPRSQFVIIGLSIFSREEENDQNFKILIISDFSNFD